MTRTTRNTTLIAGIAILAGILALPATAQAGDYCREYTKTVTVGTKRVESYGTACMQPDGSWEIQAPAAEDDDDEPAPYQHVTYRIEDRPEVVVIRDHDRYPVFIPPGHLRHHDRDNRRVVVYRPAYPHNHYSYARWNRW